MSEVYHNIANNELYELDRSLRESDEDEKKLWSSCWYKMSFESGNKHVIPLLMSYGCDPVPFMMNYLHYFEYMLRWVQDQDMLDYLLLSAAESRNEVFRCKLRILLNHGADPNTEGALFALIDRWDMEGVNMMKRFGVDMNQKNASGKTALQVMEEMEKEDEEATDEIEKDSLTLFG